MKGQLIAVFTTTHETLRAEKALKESGLKIRATVKPRKLGGSCQMALTFSPGDLDRVRNVVRDKELPLVGYFTQSEEGEWIEKN